MTVSRDQERFERLFSFVMSQKIKLSCLVNIDAGFKPEVSENDATLLPPLLLVSLSHPYQRLKAVQYV